MTIFLDQYVKRESATVPITEDVVISRLQNTKSGSGILELLFERRNANDEISPPIGELLILSITIRARKRASGEEIGSILKVLGNEGLVAQDVLKAASRSYKGAGAMRYRLSPSAAGSSDR
ncbi:uncharacterized protein BO95DRAFT_458921 [Aspergillus brunneoviolaceus CBS 621.78]|uniref:Uncharacterized protein n=1 Tax=Aspergillus brunneoviolaceus CBS 621.78 TaxID=1450534 RepID=A0ACD1GME4_9EURO|nr:hypothetical protein BO95DRAFT_458921 [Aspergillus brunneoviolaceus CBS 621.78]RAH50436.1 hypothetical protein BO95DRAFT_458921 [Aspergillus brunneoviolaceus CBS 621.78]